MPVRSYQIAQGSSGDDISIHDWNTSYAVGTGEPLIYGMDPASTALQLSAPGADGGQGPIDASTVRCGILFRNIQLPTTEALVTARLRLYLLDWDSSSWRSYFDPNAGGINPYEIHVHGCLRARPVYDVVGVPRNPFPNFPGWSIGTAYALGSFPSPDTSTTHQFWHPTRWDETGVGEINQRTNARSVVFVPRGPGAYVDIDVTSIILEIRGFNYQAATWASRAYANPTYVPAQAATAVYPGCTSFPALVYVNDCTYALARDGLSSTAPSGTGTGLIEPDGPTGAGWRYIQQGNISNWSSGNNLGFVLVPRPAGYTRYDFPAAFIPGFRTFASADAADPLQRPTLEISSVAEGEYLAVAASISCLPVTPGLQKTLIANAAIPVIGGVSRLSVSWPAAVANGLVIPVAPSLAKALVGVAANLAASTGASTTRISLAAIAAILGVEAVAPILALSAVPAMLADGTPAHFYIWDGTQEVEIFIDLSLR